MIMLIDNYDSFTYNLYQYIGQLNPCIEVHRNDKITVEEIKEKKPTHIIISPGPGFPKDAGISTRIPVKLGSSIPVLGVCLGHQGIGEAFGGKVVHAARQMHGKSSEIDIDPRCEIFAGMPKKITAARYHSLIVQRESLPKELEITAVSRENEIMGLKHKIHPVFGIQFHPESIMTQYGMDILRNFLAVA